MIRFWLYIFGKNIREVRLCSYQWYIISICPLADDVHVGRWINVMSARLDWKVTVLLLLNEKYLRERIFETT